MGKAGFDVFPSCKMKPVDLLMRLKPLWCENSDGKSEREREGEYLNEMCKQTRIINRLILYGSQRGSVVMQQDTTANVTNRS